jgi:beta-ureidopropionase / N-carbamoyl-L-amino-acid hydrolase
VTSISMPRLLGRLQTLARFGAIPGGGVTRPAWSPAYEDARRWLVGEISAAGLQPWVDLAGNTFGATGVKQFSAEHPIVLTGSHIDTVPEGGTLDGALGVVAGLECLHAIHDAGISPAWPLAVAAWSDEEGRYGSLFGSRAFCGRLDAAQVPDMAAVDGDRLVDAMARAGYDAARAAAEYALAARDVVVGEGSGRSVTNVGVVSVHPGVTNIVPGRAELVHEMRDPEAAVLERLAARCRSLAEEIAARRSIAVEVRPLSATTPAACAPRVQAAIEEACRSLDLPFLRLYSAAGHDAQNLAAVVDSGMVFVPSRGGRSHRVDEASDPDAIERGANVLLRTLLALAGAPVQ